ncbi:MAG TPA: hypothetical protein VGC53_10645 [Vicinamibacteria bacterium]
MPDFGRIINLAYMRILRRPADPGGQETYDRLMNQGMTEAMMRESLLRSPEYAANNPDVAQTGRAASAAAGSKSKKTKAKRKPKKSKSRRKAG